MSAWLVPKRHIDALVTAGLDPALQRRLMQPLTWFWPSLTDEEERDSHQAGESWGPRAIEIAQEHRRQLTDETAGRVGQMLWAENSRSVNHRYAEDEWELPYVFEAYGTKKAAPGLYVVTKTGVELTPVVVFKAIACFEYQSCESPDWERTEAFAFCRALEKATIHRLPGYEDAPWGIDS